jgi:hypothetical protein
MSATNPLLTIVRDLGLQTPIALVYLAGLVFALTNLSRVQRPSIIAGGGLAVLLLLIVIRTIANSIIGRAVGYPDAIMVLGLVHFFLNIIQAAAIGALIYAVFADRPAAVGGKPIG